MLAGGVELVDAEQRFFSEGGSNDLIVSFFGVSFKLSITLYLWDPQTKRPEEALSRSAHPGDG